jgi:hypothetical protein
VIVAASVEKMGKKQHSKDKMYITATEHKYQYGGKLINVCYHLLSRLNSNSWQPNHLGLNMMFVVLIDSMTHRLRRLFGRCHMIDVRWV